MKCIRVFLIMVLNSWVLLAGSGCIDSGSGSDDTGDLSHLAGTAFSATVNMDGYIAGSYSIVDENGNVYADLVSFGTTDLGVEVFNDSIYVFGKYGNDWLAKYNLSDVNNHAYQYSLKEWWEDSGNPKHIRFINDNVAYVFRYGSPISWIIDPTPADEDLFKIGEIYMFDYMTGDNPPNPVASLIDGTTMYVLLEQSNFYAYDHDSILLTYDISTLESPVLTDEFTLIVRGANVIQKLGTDLYIAGYGATPFMGAGTHTPTGGIEVVDISGGVGSYSSLLLVDDDDGSDTYGNAYTYDGFMSSVIVISATQGYIYFYERNTDIFKIHPFNPTTGVVDESTFLHQGINFSQVTLEADGLIHCCASDWEGLGAAAGLYTIDPSDNSTTGPLNVGLEPAFFSMNN